MGCHNKPLLVDELWLCDHCEKNTGRKVEKGSLKSNRDVFLLAVD